MEKDIYEFMIYDECGVLIFHIDFVIDQELDFQIRMQEEKSFKNRM